MQTDTASTLPPPPLPPLSGPPPAPPSQPPTREVAPPPPPEETARSAALWLGGTGALLLLIAAAVLVAVRWDDLTAWMKLGGLILANAGVLSAAFRLREPLPATARALHHLGALLLPISAVALGIQAELPWAYTVLVSSVFTIPALLWLDRIEPSPALRWVAMAAVVPAAGGLGAVLSVPAGLILAFASLAVALTAPDRHSPSWFACLSGAALSGSLAFLVTVDDPLIRTSNVLAELGLGPQTGWWVHIVVGLLAAATFAVIANRENDETLAVAAVAVGLAGAVAGVAELNPSGPTTWNTVVAMAVGFEFAALALRRDRLWGPISQAGSTLAEVVMAVAMVNLVGQVDGWVLDSRLVPGAIATAGLLLIGWFVADQRRRTHDCQSLPMVLLTGGGWWPATLGIAISTLLLSGAIGVSLAAVSWTAAAVAIVLVISGRAGAHATSVVMAATAILLAGGSWPLFIISAATAATLAWAAAIRTAKGDRVDPGAQMMLAAALLAWVPGAFELSNLGPNMASIEWVALVGGAALLTLLAERGSTDPVHTGVGLIGRGAVALVFVPALLWGGADSTLAALVLAVGLTALDIARTGDHRLGYPLVMLAPVLAGVVAGVANLTPGETGIAVAALATAGVGAMVTLRYQHGWAISTTASLAMASLADSAAEAGSLSTVLLLWGAAGMLVGIDRVSLDITVGSALVLITGLWVRLALLDIGWSEAYVAPVAVLLVLLGIATKDSGVRSWWTHGAAVALLGGAALAERVAGGPGEHALIAGSVALLGLLWGAERRLIGPLVLGTALIVAVSAHESLAYTARIPTWGWLALGGATLLGAAVVIERTATSPLESGRRVVQTVNSSFR